MACASVTSTSVHIANLSSFSEQEGLVFAAGWEQPATSAVPQTTPGLQDLI